MSIKVLEARDCGDCVRFRFHLDESRIRVVRPAVIERVNIGTTRAPEFVDLVVEDEVIEPDPVAILDLQWGIEPRGRVVNAAGEFVAETAAQYARRRTDTLEMAEREAKLLAEARAASMAPPVANPLALEGTTL